METETIYARVPVSLREAVRQYQGDRESNLTSAVISLLTQGLEANDSSEARVAMRAEIDALKQENEALAAKLHEAQAVIKELKRQEETLSLTYRSLAQRTRQQVAVCPDCGIGVTGEDLLVAAKCKNDHSLAKLLQGRGIRPEYLILMGAVGVIVGIAIAESQG